MRVSVRLFLAATLILGAISGWTAEPVGAKGVITKLDSQSRVVGVKLEGGKVWELTLGSSEALSELKMGQQVVVDLTGKTLSLAKNKFAIAKASETRPELKKNMGLFTLLGQGDFVVTRAGSNWVEFKNLKTEKTARYRITSGEFAIGRRIKVTAEDFANSGGTGADLNCGSCRKDCTIVSTGSDPSPSDDTVSCVCISPDGRSCG